MTDLIDSFFRYLILVDDFFWAYIGLGLLLFTGLVLTWRSKFYQFRVIEHLPTTIRSLVQASKKDMPGLSPMRLYFASVGGTIGLGNISAVVTALLLGGPGALFWLWLAALSGMLVKYAEIYLGLKYRQRNASGSYDGGPMYTVPFAFPGKLGVILAQIAAFLLCIYGVEVYQFTVIADTLHDITHWSREWVIFGLLSFSLYISIGGVKRLANFCSVLMPVFIVGYVCLCLGVLLANYAILPDVLISIFKSAFMGHAAVGGFAGSTVLMAAQQGAAQGVYSGDIAIGFDAIVQSESKVTNPEQQARIAIIGVGTDAFICTMSILVVMVTSVWITEPCMKVSEYVSSALSLYYPNISWIIVTIIFLAGFTTIQAYFVVGLKAAKFLAPKRGRMLYLIYAVLGFWLFAHVDQSYVLVIMNFSGGLLVLINLASILRLRKELNFKFAELKPKE